MGSDQRMAVSLERNYLHVLTTLHQRSHRHVRTGKRRCRPPSTCMIRRHSSVSQLLGIVSKTVANCTWERNCTYTGLTEHV